jgi:transcription elongation factor GreA
LPAAPRRIAAGAVELAPLASCIPGVAGVRCGKGRIDGGTASEHGSRIRGVALRTKGPMEKIPMTRAGFAALDEELKQLKSVERPAVIRAISEAREHGDLSENAEYHAAREKQSFIEGRIKELESILARSEVIDPARLSGAIKFGATVTLIDEDTEEEKTYQIVGEAEADLERGLLNMKSPLARALIGKEEGDSVDVKTPGGERSYEVLSIRYI